MNASDITFQKVSDSPESWQLIFSWIQSCSTSEFEQEKRLQNSKELQLNAQNQKCSYYLIQHSKHSIGFFQATPCSQRQNYQPKGTYEFNFSITEKNLRGENNDFESILIKRIINYLFENSKVQKIISKPRPSETQAMHAFHKAGMNLAQTLGSKRKQVNLFQVLRYPLIQTPRTILRLAKEADIPNIIQFLKKNYDTHFKEWEPEPSYSLYEKEYWMQQVASDGYGFSQDKSCRLIQISKNTNEIIGQINFDAFSRGIFQNCRVGYKIDQSCINQGLMSESLEAAINYIFQSLQLHRIEANFRPENFASEKVLKKLGFKISGNSKDYLKINGQWCDHIHSYLLNPNPNIFN